MMNMRNFYASKNYLTIRKGPAMILKCVPPSGFVWVYIFNTNADRPPVKHGGYNLNFELHYLFVKTIFNHPQRGYIFSSLFSLSSSLKRQFVAKRE